MHALRTAHEAAERRIDARFALVCAVLANVNRDPKRSPQPYAVEDFMPGQRPQTRQEFDARLANFTTWLNTLPKITK